MVIDTHGPDPLQVELGVMHDEQACLFLYQPFHFVKPVRVGGLI